MSEHITHIAVYEDCARFILHTDRFCEAFRTCVREQYDAGLMTSGTRGNHIFAVPILEKYKDQWDQVKDVEEAQMQISGSIGWVTHRAADLQMKPTWRAKVAEDPDFPDTEMQIYHDSVTFREVYQGGNISTLSPLELMTPQTLEKEMTSHPAGGILDTEKVEELVTYLWQKEFVELHSFHKNGPDVGKWVDHFVEYHQEFTEDLRTYIEAFQNPDPGKTEAYIDSINYYDAADPLIQWVRGIQLEKDVSGIDLDQALSQAGGQSQYAQALLKGYNFLMDASDYFMNRLEKDTLYDTMGMPADQRP